jgi:hypothetical protein
MSNRVALLLSPYFPPSTLAGVHRARHLAKHLPSAGWTPIVLCVNETYHAERIEPDLSALVPRDVEVIKVKALSARLARHFGIGEISLRAWFALRHALFHLLETRRAGVLLITGSPYYPMLLAPQVKQRFCVPIVLDFQDPWVSSWGALQPALSKAQAAHRLAVALEPRALRGADFVTSVSDVQNAEMAARYSWLDAAKMAAIPIGGDPDDFVTLSEALAKRELLDEEPDRLHFTYVGTSLPRADSPMRTLFRAFARLRSSEPALAARIRMNFIGTSNQPNDVSSFRVRALAAAEGVDDVVREIPQRLPYSSALAWLTRSRGLLLIGSDEPHYTASKIYPALMSGTPFISLFHHASSAHAILSRAGGGRAFSFEAANDLAALDVPLAEALRRLAVDPNSFGIANPSAWAPYEARAVSQRFADIFDNLVAPKASSHRVRNHPRPQPARFGVLTRRTPHI